MRLNTEKFMLATKYQPDTCVEIYRSQKYLYYENVFTSLMLWEVYTINLIVEKIRSYRSAAPAEGRLQ